MLPSFANFAIDTALPCYFSTVPLAPSSILMLLQHLEQLGIAAAHLDMNCFQFTRHPVNTGSYSIYVIISQVLFIHGCKPWQTYCEISESNLYESQENNIHYKACIVSCNSLINFTNHRKL